MADEDSHELPHDSPAASAERIHVMPPLIDDTALKALRHRAAKNRRIVACCVVVLLLVNAAVLAPLAANFTLRALQPNFREDGLRYDFWFDAAHLWLSIFTMIATLMIVLALKQTVEMFPPLPLPRTIPLMPSLTIIEVHAPGPPSDEAGAAGQPSEPV